METSDTTRLLEDLHQTLEDGRQGFETAADKLNEDGHADLASQMREFSQQRSRLSSELVKYKEVLDEDIPAGLKAFVTKQATEVKAAHDKVRELRDANAS